MKSIGLAILERDPDFAETLRAFFDGTEGFDVRFVGADAEAARESVADAVVIDPLLAGADGLGVIDGIKRANPDCVVIAVSALSDDRLIKLAFNHGVDYYFIKPVSPSDIRDRLTEIINGEGSKRRGRKMEERISEIFMTIGIPPHIKGFGYLREGIKLAVEEPGIINRVTKELYPRIAEKFSATPSKVERAIRHAIEVAWNRGRADEIGFVFGARVYIGRERPTNSEFIALVADKLILEQLS